MDRLPRYELLLRELIKHSQVDEVDGSVEDTCETIIKDNLKALNLALASIHNTVVTVNQHKVGTLRDSAAGEGGGYVSIRFQGDSERRDLVLSAALRIQLIPIHIELVQPHRELLAEAWLTVCQHTAALFLGSG